MRRRAYCPTCGIPLLERTERWWSLGTVMWCPDCGAKALKRTGLILVAPADIVLIYTCSGCGKSRSEVETRLEAAA